MKDTVIIFAILSILIIELVALFNGIDGAILMGSLTIIGGLAGYKKGVASCES